MKILLQSLFIFNKKSNQINVSQNNNIIRKINVNQTNDINLDNLSKNPKKILLNDKLNSKIVNNDQNNNFNFKGAKWSLTIIYLFSFIIIPIFYSLIKSYVLIPTPDEFFDILFFNFIPILGLLISLPLDTKVMIKNGGWAAYSHPIFGLIGAIFIGIFLTSTHLISDNKHDLTSQSIIFLVGQLFQLLGSILVLVFSKSLRQRIINTFKMEKLDLMTLVTIFVVIATILDIVINLIPTTNQNDGSENQNKLNLLTKTPLGIISLLIGTVFIAPISEEISYRHGIFTIVRYQWLGFLASFIYFPAMHVMWNGDWINIKGYLAISVLLPLIFIMKKGNVTYTIAMHASLNFIANVMNFIK